MGTTSNQPEEIGQEAETDWLRWLIRFLIFIAAVVICLVAALLLVFIWQDSQQNVIGNSGIQNPMERLYLRAYLAARSDELEKPIGRGINEITFVIEPGQNANQISNNLVESGLLPEADLFRNYLRYKGYDSQLEAGIFEINPSLTIPQLASTLLRAQPQDIELVFLPGWRKEEMAEYLRVIQPAKIEADEFEALVSGGNGLDLSGYDFLSSLPENATLEGFLFPDTYRLPVDATAPQLIYMMLDNFNLRVTPAMRQSFGIQGLSVYDAVILASIVQREAVVADERPLMVGVFLNRLNAGMPLQADPTVQYALGYLEDVGTWWKSPLSAEDLKIDTPYNTYLYPGLPPGPIANPGLTALEAVSSPERSDFLFFVADCTSENPGLHVFSRTFEEHLSHVNRCR
jgi:UPF0755 protein